MIEVLREMVDRSAGEWGARARRFVDVSHA
jgi:hypothetical protein